MKKLLIVILGLFLCCNTEAQKIQTDSLFFPDYPKDLRSMLLYNPDIPQEPLMLYKTASVLVGTFLINEAIIRHSHNTGNYKNTTKITGPIFLVGIATTMIVCFKEVENYEEKKLIESKNITDTELIE